MKKVLGKGIEALIPGAASATGAGAAGTGGQADDERVVTEYAGPNVIREIPVARIKPSPFQPRMTFAKEGIEELARSIEARGVIQPIVVRVINDSYELIVGERRLRAVESLGRTTIPAVIHEGASNEEAMELTLIENIQREDLNAIEEAQAYYRLMKDCNLSAPEVASKVGKDRSTVANAVRLLTLPEEIVKMIYAGQLSAGHARTLLAVPDDNEKIALAQKVSLGMLSVRELERAVYSERPDKRPKAPEKRVRIRPIEIIALEEKLKRTLGTKVQLKHKGRGGRIIVEYYSNDELDRLLAIFGVSMIRE